jgi:hypothetical protein
MFGGKGFFGSLFDLNGDGKLDSFEETMDFAAFAELMEEDEEEEKDDGDDGAS